MNETKRYEGTKRLSATPMTRGEYNAYRGWKLPDGESPGDAGYLVEYEDGGKPNHANHKNYISWSPKDVFERSYREIQPALPMRYPQGAAPRVTELEVDQAIHRQDFTLLPDGRTTICTLTLYNGFTVRGESSCVCIENFDLMKGREIASQNARSEVWKLLGFRLAENLHNLAHGPIATQVRP
jgi:hypothetical protein